MRRLLNLTENKQRLSGYWPAVLHTGRALAGALPAMDMRTVHGKTHFHCNEYAHHINSHHTTNCAEIYFALPPYMPPSRIRFGFRLSQYGDCRPPLAILNLPQN